MPSMWCFYTGIMGGEIELRRLLLITVIIIFIAVSTYSQGERNKMEETVRQPAVAGQFYNSDPEALRSAIRDFLSRAEPGRVDGEIIALVSPHAGYPYSGEVAAHGYELVQGKDYSNVVVISPSHYDHFNFSSVFSGRGYLTPLGEIRVNRKISKTLAEKSDMIRISERGHLSSAMGRGEHALEVQLPFLQTVLGNFNLIPIVMGDQNRGTVEELGRALGDVLQGKDVLIVASTDLSHFHSDREARKLDRIFMNKLEDFSPYDLMEAIGTGRTEACGGGPTAAAMMAARMMGADGCEVLTYANSGDITGDTSGVVGYTSAVILKSKSENHSGGQQEEGKKDNPGGRELSRDDKIFLLKMTREVIRAECEGTEPDIPENSSPVMQENRGVFVTIKKDGQLRGCIGYVEAVKSLYQSVKDMAFSAAFRDYRFPPVKAPEVPQLEISISVLSPIFEISDPSNVEVGKHGLIISRGSQRGLLLPQVPVEWSWDRETFLDQTCVKAGLPKGCWKKEGAKIEAFTADVFSEEELGLSHDR